MNDNSDIGFFVYSRTSNYNELRLYKNGEPTNQFFAKALSKEELIRLREIIDEILKQWND